MTRKSKQTRQRPQTPQHGGMPSNLAQPVPVETGLLAQIKTWHIILAFILAVIALSKGIVEFYNLVKPRNAIPQFEQIEYLNMQRNSDGSVRFTFPLTVSNTGQKEFEIVSAQGKIVPSSSPQDPLHFQSTTAEFSEADKPLETPFPISPGGARRRVMCSVFFPINEELPTDFKVPGERRLLIDFNAKGARLPQFAFCFELTDNQRPAESFLLPECSEGGQSAP